MDATGSVKLAIDLVQCPSQVRALRSGPLPGGMLSLLRIAAGDEEVTKEAAATLNRSYDMVREAAGFFVEQILLHPDADSYRVLGARPGASYAELRRNMTLLLRWLHPDLDPNGERTVFAARVTRAWNDLKTEDRRVAYDRSQRIASAEASLLRKRGNVRAHSKQGPDARPQFGRVARKHVVSSRLTRRHLENRRGLLHWVFLQLFGRDVP